VHYSPRVKKGYLYRYSKLVGPALKGGFLADEWFIDMPLIHPPIVEEEVQFCIFGEQRRGRKKVGPRIIQL
jgi:hypothetical protein